MYLYFFTSLIFAFYFMLDENYSYCSFFFFTFRSGFLASRLTMTNPPSSTIMPLLRIHLPSSTQTLVQDGLWACHSSTGSPKSLTFSSANNVNAVTLWGKVTRVGMIDGTWNCSGCCGGTVFLVSLGKFRSSQLLCKEVMAMVCFFFVFCFFLTRHCNIDQNIIMYCLTWINRH